MAYRVLGKKKPLSVTTMQIWRHNGLLGQVKRAALAMKAVRDAETPTDECHSMAEALEPLLEELFQKLHVRKDQLK